MTGLNYVKHQPLLLKGHSDFNEKWLQDRIADDPAILGLGETVLLGRERPQERAGRLDLLLTSPEQDQRYEVELMLGATDASHIIRCIEYWDIERRRYPGYEHCAVLVAEDITSRFLNVIGLLAGTVPLVAIQLNALSVGDNVILNFVRVLDQRLLRRDDTSITNPQPVERSYWINKSKESIIHLADEVLGIINEKAQPPQQLNYNKHYIGLSDGIRARRFIYFRPQKKFLKVVIPDGWSEERSALFDATEIEADEKNGRLRLSLSPANFKQHDELVRSVIHEVVEQQNT